MGFFDWIFKREKKERGRVSKEIKINDLSKELKDLEKEIFSDLYKEADAFKKRFENSFQEIVDNLVKLEQAKTNADVDPRLKTKIESSRKNFIDQIRLADKTLSKKSFNIADFTGIRELLEGYSEQINKVNSAGSKYGGPIALIYKGPIGGVNSRLRNTIAILNKFSDKFKENKSIQEFEELLDISNKLKNLVEFRKMSEVDLTDKREELTERELELNKLTSEKNKIIHSDEYKISLDLQKQLETLVTELNSLKIRTRNRFGDVTKALSKFTHNYPLSSNEERIVESYLSEPFDAVDLDSKLQIKDLLKQLKHRVENNSVQLDERIKNKTISVISELLSGNEIENIISRKRELQDKIQEIETSLEKSGIHKINMLDIKIKRLGKQVSDSEIAIEVQQELLNKNKNGVDKLKSSIEALFSKFSIDAKIFID